MTACVNKNHGRRVAGVVTASLVGALTLGGVSLAAVPTVALAEQGSLQADWTTSAEVTAATDGTGVSVKDPSKASFGSKSGKYLVPTQVTNKFGTVTDLTDTTAYTFTYQKADGTGLKVSNNGADFDDVTAAFSDGGKFTAAGKYKVTVTEKGKTTPSLDAYFDVEQRTLVGAKQDGELTYNGTDRRNDASFVDAAGNALSLVTTDNPKGDYTIGNIDRVDSAGNTLTNAGTYKVRLNGQNAYAGTTAVVDVKVGKLDLSKAQVSVDDVQRGTVTDAWVEANLKLAGKNFSAGSLNQFTDFTVSGPDNRKLDAQNEKSYGVFTVALKAVDVDPNSNVTGETTVTFTNYEVSAGTAYYDGDVFSGSETAPFKVRLDKGESWDESKLVFKDGRETYKGATTVTYANEKGEKVDAAALKEPGKYTVTITADAAKNNAGEWVGGTASAVVEVSGSQAWADEDLAYYLDGEAVDGFKKDVVYDGSDFLKALTAKVVDADGKSYEQGKDFELVAKDADTGKEVESITEAGDYEVTVKPLTFQWADSHKDDALTLSVKPVQVKDYKYRVTDDKGNNVNKVADGLRAKSAELIWTGSDLAVPAVQYLAYKDASFTEPKKSESGSFVYADLASDLYNVVSIKDVTEGKVVKAINADHEYEVTIALSDKAGSNYGLKHNKFTVKVRKAESFADVAADRWYAKPVEQAFKNYYINGTSGTQLFSPEADITRADAVGILFNMAGGNNVTEDLVQGENGYVTGFSDVDGHVYYAKALAWAHKVGVANGYADGTFEPNAKLTREQFAAFLMNYAKATGKYTAATEDKLSGLSDASGVSPWATEAVNWAVSNKVMGNGGYVAATSNISRAEVAAMGVNFQPKALFKTITLDDGTKVTPGQREH